MFEVKGASFEVEGRRILQPTDLSLEAGLVYGLIGHNGSGKSTLVKLLAGQHSPSGGMIRFQGRELSRWGGRAFAREVAYLPQRLPDTESLTGRELVALGRYPWHGLLRRLGDEDRHHIDRAMALTQTEPFAERMVDTLSGGERQRVWLAMLLAQGSRFLILDEPLTALDIAHQVEMLALIRRLSHELGLGVVIVLHDINMAAHYCDQLIALRQGRLLAEGTPDAMMEEATLRDIYGIPMEVVPHPENGLPVALVHYTRPEDTGRTSAQEPPTDRYAAGG
ncbi:Iron(3+)-hydroxamate import ATP-binding protein FhuC [wastewater metagenome]|uniref:Iron(3+)-hydroxamate import ATP-binding protein FhuC n=3 Tax=root TaxID=1 RepID=A0A5B8RJI6_9ZZZZ|nr:ATP-binding cassette domain-containing protein [Arhodomonas aquaeolei]MCS4504758.1 ATP-binding cassette domain-containing protein [Arhodomonas aquaeolei]QEA07027.1 iron(3+)-hydroxamate import ATP-binding protein FhuC [uncultured organism]